MKKLKSISFTKEVRKIGDSLGIIFSKQECERYNIKLNSKLNLDDVFVEDLDDK